MIGRSAPDFDLPCVDATGKFEQRTLGSYRGGWLALVFYPRDFSVVCPTELVALSARWDDFSQRQCQILGVSVDTIESHRLWRTVDEADGGVGALRFELAADEEGLVSRRYGAWLEDERVSMRALYLIDPTGIVQYVVQHNLSVGRNVDEVLRVLDALQSGGLCPASWRNADGTINLGRALRPGRVLGHFRLREELGAGAFGRVYSAWDLQLEREVALKVLLENEARERFLAEARAVAQVVHPNVCGIYSVEVHDGLAMIAMPLIHGPSLDAVLPTLNRRERIETAIGIAEGIAAAHAVQIAHGDLKPANILLDEDHKPVIVDFGLAKIHRGPVQPTLDISVSKSGRKTSPLARVAASQLEDTVQWQATELDEEASRRDTLSGTPAYMSPEQLLGEPATTASDVYAFGLLLRDMLCQPHAYQSMADIFAERLNDVRLQPHLCVGQPAESHIIERLLHRRPQSRPPMTEVVQQLQELL